MTQARSIVRHVLPLFAGSLFLAGSGLALAQQAPATEAFPLRMDGDLGLGAYYTRSIIRGKSEPAAVLPYAYFDYGRAFARIDTLGIKTVKMGYGYLELVGRVSLDGFKADTPSLRGLTDRKSSVPLGIGTYQDTPIGGFFLNAFHDVGKSNGNMLEGIYAGELKTSRVTYYPQLGAEYLSRQYVGYYYGVSAAESAASAYAAYRPGSAVNPFVALLAEARLTDDVNLNLYLRHKWLAGAIKNSAIVERGAMDSVFVAVSYRFK